MKNEEVKNIIVEILQESLRSNLENATEINPQHIADAIIAKVRFNSSYDEMTNKEMKLSLLNSIEADKIEMNKELYDLKEGEELLSNFIIGKITAYDEMIDHLNE
jgi:hypothetical protein